VRGKIKKIISVGIVFVILMTFASACDMDNADINMEYSGTNIANSELSMVSSRKASGNLIGHNVCVVNKGSDVGGDSNITCNASLIFCVNDQKVLYANNLYNKIYLASITKIFTTYTALKSGKNLDDIVTVTKNAEDIKNNPGAQYGGLKTGDKMKLRDLIYYMMIYSANDAGIAIAEHIGKDVPTFANMMNEEAKKVGCIGSNFVNPHGLHDDNHYTTAYDIYLVFNKLLEYDIFLDMIKRDSYSFSYTTASGSKSSLSKTATNKYLSGKFTPPSGITVLGGKTGNTDQAGKCLIIASEDGAKKKYISLVLHAKDDNDLYSQMNLLLSKIK